MDWGILIGCISLIISIVAFVCSTSLFQISIMGANISVSLDALNWIINEKDDINNKLQFSICNYANRDILLVFTDGYIQNGEHRMKIVANQCIKLSANSLTHVALDIEPDYPHDNNLLKKMDLCYKKFGIF